MDEDVLGVCVVTFDSCHCSPFTDPVCAYMSVSSGKVLSPEDEGSMAGFAFVIIFARLVLDMLFSSIFRASWYFLMSMPNARVSVCTARQAY